MANVIMLAQPQITLTPLMFGTNTFGKPHAYKQIHTYTMPNTYIYMNQNRTVRQHQPAVVVLAAVVVVGSVCMVAMHSFVMVVASCILTPPLQPFNLFETNTFGKPHPCQHINHVKHMYTYINT